MLEKLNEIGVLFHSRIRGLMYLEAFVRNGVIPNIVIIQGEIQSEINKRQSDNFWKKYVKYLDINKTLEYYLSELSIDSVQLRSSDVNCEEMRGIVVDRPERYFIFSGGGIIGQPLFNTGKRFIHIHSGVLPEFRGSTCYYYSILKKNQCGASAFFMQRKLDSGEVITNKLFEVPSIPEEDWIFFDLLYDPWIRAELLFEIIKSYKEKRVFNSNPQEAAKGEMYFIIHPVLKNLAIKRKVIQYNLNST